MTIHPVVSDEGRQHVKTLVIESVARLDRGSRLKFRQVKDELTGIAADDLQSNYVGIRQAFIEELTVQVDLAVRTELLPESTEESGGVRSSEAGAETSNGDVAPLRSEHHLATDADLHTAIRAARGAFNWLAWRQ